METESSLQNAVSDELTRVDEVQEVVVVGNLVHSDVGSNDGSGFKSAVSHHVEDVDNIVGKAVSLEVGAFLVVVHFEFTAGHLNHTVVDGFVCVQNGFIVGLLDGKKGARCLVSLISSTNIEEDTHINDIRENLGFSEDGDSVLQLRDFVVRGLEVSVLGFVFSEGLGRVENGILIEGIREVLSVEDFKKTALKTGKAGLLSLEGGVDERS